MRLRGGRTGLRAVTCQDLTLTGLVAPFDLEVFYGERVAVLGPNGSGKSHFLRLLAGEEVAHTGGWKLGARVVPGYFAQTHAHPELASRTLAEVLWADYAKDRGAAMSVLRRYELERQGDQRFEKLSGGQQARFQILQLELAGSTLLLLDEPTDNLDLDSAEALQAGLEAYAGTVLAVTHDRWFAQSFDRYLFIGQDGKMRETLEPVWQERLVCPAGGNRYGAAGHTRVCGHDEPDTAGCQPALSRTAAAWMQISGSTPCTRRTTPQSCVTPAAGRTLTPRAMWPRRRSSSPGGGGRMSRLIRSRYNHGCTGWPAVCWLTQTGHAGDRSSWRRG